MSYDLGKRGGGMNPLDLKQFLAKIAKHAPVVPASVVVAAVTASTTLGHSYSVWDPFSWV
jgi:glycerol-3-phosphate acyltransferase PlsY